MGPICYWRVGTVISRVSLAGNHSLQRRFIRCIPLLASISSSSSVKLSSCVTRFVTSVTGFVTPYRVGTFRELPTIGNPRVTAATRPIQSKNGCPCPVRTRHLPCRPCGTRLGLRWPNRDPSLHTGCSRAGKGRRPLPDAGPLCQCHCPQTTTGQSPPFVRPKCAPEERPRGPRTSGHC